jgi:hypothetical protein
MGPAADGTGSGTGMVETCHDAFSSLAVELIATSHEATGFVSEPLSG